MAILPEFRKQRQGSFEFEVSLGYAATSRLAVTTVNKPVSNKQDAHQSSYAAPCRMPEQCAEVPRFNARCQRVEGEKGKEQNATSTVE